MDALRTKGVSKIERVKKNGLMLLLVFCIVVIVSIIALSIGAFIGSIACIPAMLAAMTFSAAWNLYGFMLAGITTILSFIAGLLLVAVLGVNEMMFGMPPPKGNYM